MVLYIYVCMYKVIAFVFWGDSEGIIMIECLVKGKKILIDSTRHQSSWNVEGCALWLQDNMPIHTAQVAITEMTNCDIYI